MHGRSVRHRRAFTLVEVMATVLLISICIPVINRSIETAALAGDAARHRTEAAGLAQSKLSELIVGATWQNGQMSGDFGPDWKQYTWQATVENWTGDTQEVGLQQLDVQVLWTSRNTQQSITVSSLVYIRPVPTS